MGIVVSDFVGFDLLATNNLIFSLLAESIFFESVGITSTDYLPKFDMSEIVLYLLKLTAD